MQSAIETSVRTLQARRRLALAALPETSFHGLAVLDATPFKTVDWLCARLEMNIPTRIAFLTAGRFHRSTRQPIYRSALSTADAICPFGPRLAWAQRLLGKPLAADLGPAALVPALCRQLAYTGHGVFLLGGRSGRAEAAASRLLQIAPGLIIAGTRHGNFSEDDDFGVVRSINASGASVVVTAFGTPEQDIWLARNAIRLKSTLAIGAGTYAWVCRGNTDAELLMPYRPVQAAPDAWLGY